MGVAPVRWLRWLDEGGERGARWWWLGVGNAEYTEGARCEKMAVCCSRWLRAALGSTVWVIVIGALGPRVKAPRRQGGGKGKSHHHRGQEALH